MKQSYKHTIALLALLSMLATSTTQACMTVVYMSTAPEVSSYKTMGDVVASPPLVVISVEGTAILNLPKQNASDQWVFKNEVDIIGPFSVQIEESVENGQPFTHIVFEYKQIDCDRDSSSFMCVSVKEIEMPMIFSYESDGKEPIEVKGTLKVSSGKQIVLTPEVKDMVIQINGEMTEGMVYSGRPYRIEWLNPALGKHHWQVKEALIETGEKAHWWSKNTEPTEVEAVTNSDGSMMFRGYGHGTKMRIVLKAIKQTGDDTPLPKPVTIILHVEPSITC